MSGKTDKLSFRKQASIWALLLIIKIIEPKEYSHDYENELKMLKEKLKNI